MATVKFPIPIGGVFYGFNPEDTSGQYSQNMLNCRPLDTLENKIRLGQRPGLKKLYTDQISGSAQAIVEMGYVSSRSD